jgi:RecA-family ATPase
MDRLLRQSGLMRDKWDEKRGAHTYGQITIEKAITPQVPTPPPGNNGGQPTTPSPIERTIAIHWAGETLEPQPPIDWIIQDLFSAGSVSLLVGEGGAKKTYAMLDAAVAVALGQLWLGFTTRQGTALLIDEESGPRRLARRIGDTLRGHNAGPDTPLAYVTLAGFDLRALESVNTLQAVIMTTGARFVLLDALVDFMLTGDENDVKDVQPVFRNLRGIAEITQSGIVAIHHVNKAGGYRGSSAMKGAVDLLLTVESKPDSITVTFRSEKTRDIEPVTFGATANFGANSFYLSPAEAAAYSGHFSGAERYVLRYLREKDSSIDDIKTHADACTEEAARRAVYRLADKGELARVDGGGRGSQAIYALTPQGVVSCDKL